MTEQPAVVQAAPAVEAAAGPEWAKGAPLGLLTLGGLGCAAALLFLALGAVLEIGGACGTGRAVASCPHGVDAVTIGGIAGGLVFALLYRAAVSAYGLPGLDWLFSAALFLLIAARFFQFGVDPPGGGGVAWGWLVGGLAFAVPSGILLAQAIRAKLSAAKGVPPALPFWLAMQLLVLAAGVWGGTRLYHLATG
jgi:hypothetical protein